MEAKEREKPLVKDLNEHIVCPLCRGYLIDATTLVECLHSFCRGCIVRRLSSGARACPVCNVATSPPLLPDVKLQRLVYLVVPGLFRSELERRRHFRLVNPQCPPVAPPLGALDLTLDDFVSLSLCELDEPEEEAQSTENRTGSSRHRDNVDQAKEEDNDARVRSTRYLKCPAGVTVRHLVRLLMLKRGWEEANSQGSNVNKIEMLCEKSDEHRRGSSSMMILNQSWTLMDLACIFGWKRESPMKLFYHVVKKEDAISVSTVSPYSGEATKDAAASMENIQRPPTPPPSPKPAPECDVEARKILESSVEPPRSLESNLERDKEPKAKKPRCEVTPVMRTPDLVPLQPSHAPESTKTKELARLEHRKRRKRRNKRVIAEITTTPREDLLKLKVRLTPCPPRITSSTGSGQTKEKLLQMRAVRREKIKATAIGQQRSTTSSLVREEAGAKENLGETEETIEEIIDSIPDEVVRIAQNISTQGEEAVVAAERMEQRSAPSACRPSPKFKEEPEPETKVVVEKLETGRPKQDEEILRRLGLVAVNETSDNFRDKTKQRAQNNGEKVDNLDREKLEKQLRESKANRVRSLLAEKQMRDALKSIMSKTKEEHPPAVQVNAVPKKKGPPPLAPLRVAKPSGFATTSAILEPNNSKYEIPLDLSSGGTVHNNILDLSASLSTSNFSSSSSSSSSSPSSSSSSSSSSCSSLNPRGPRPPIATGSLLRGKTKDLEQRRGQESNLVTLSNAAVSLLSECITDKNSVDPLVLGSANIASKVALRIPQPHQRISGFGMKIKPNLGIRHIPNPQAVVASQYRNQRASYFNAASQQPP
ncbi:uncharacterized protein LOC143183110 [Calliopsis andreniformis]|uniref:uncharacterized protein LOC143183110 n=1 Tax=Calliopsis andreniformis TaxID=337506 RepID=UPI003FCD4875